jgi:hypothetical protein
LFPVKVAIFLAVRSRAITKRLEIDRASIITVQATVDAVNFNPVHVPGGFAETPSTPRVREIPAAMRQFMMTVTALAAFGTIVVTAQAGNQTPMPRCRFFWFLQLAAVLQGIGQAVAYGLLFTPSARRWMNRQNEKLREVFV